MWNLQINNVDFGYVIGTLKFELNLGYIYLTTASDGTHTQKIECNTSPTASATAKYTFLLRSASQHH